MRLYKQFVFVLIQAIRYGLINCQLTGEGCVSDTGGGGRCLLLDKCQSAIEKIRANINPKICGFDGKIPIVCCDNVISRTPSIAARKCEEYKLKSKPTTTTTTTARPRRRQFNSQVIDDIFVLGGVDALPLEFPHMAILGYGSGKDTKWFCGGSLISENFVLTAAHCTYTKYGNVSTIKLGIHHIRTVTQHIQTFSVKRMVQHPEYSPLQNYHDIALIELDRPANIRNDIRPACLHTARELSNTSFTATGWGATELYGNITDILQKVNLTYVTYNACVGYYKKQNKLANGVVDEWQICADGGNEKADTCQGDSGGPLHLPRTDRGIYTVAGITSFGIKCAIVPAIYTRVSYYVPWIESVVWSN